VRALFAKAQTGQRMLKVYKTALIPQATATLNSSRIAYRAGKSNFMELIDSERSVYTIQISYYRTLSQFVESVAMLEERVGASVSTLPFGDLKVGD